MAARDLGISIQIATAIDINAAALRTYKANFPTAKTVLGDVDSIFSNEVGDETSLEEEQIRKQSGRVDVLIGGPPCEGNSDLNNHTRRRDDRNALYAKMSRAAEVLRPKIVVIENVPTVANDSLSVLSKTEQGLKLLGYETQSGVFDFSRFGVPQLRRRHILLAVRSKTSPADMILALEKIQEQFCVRPVMWAIDDIDNPGVVSSFSRTTNVSSENEERIDWLFDQDSYELPNRLRPVCHQKEHSYKAMYGRLRADQPTPTLTTGFRSMGQGRYVHPTRRRMITPHEAARIQSFPDYFKFPVDLTRDALSTQIGNAVPPFAARAIGTVVLQAWLDDQSDE